MATLPRSFWRLGTMLEDRISTAIRQIPYNAWWEDHITYEWLSSIAPVLNGVKLEGTTEERLVTSIAMVCPFEPLEKQGLLEAKDLAERAKMLIGIVEAALSAPPEGARPN